jgi:hypothetical protein
MDAETPTGGTDRTEGFAPERKKTSCRGTLEEINLEGLCPFQWNVCLGIGLPICVICLMCRCSLRGGGRRHIHFQLGEECKDSRYRHHPSRFY